MKRYPFLWRAVRIVRILAWLELVLGIIGSIVFAVSLGAISGGAGSAILIVILGVLYSILAWIFLLATAEIFLLLIDVEENTRKAVEGHK